MKKVFFTLSLATFLLSACSDNQNKEQKLNDGTHQHEDGSVHQNHEEDTIKQEEFNAPIDTSISEEVQVKGHTHEGHEHPHKH